VDVDSSVRSRHISPSEQPAGTCIEGTKGSATTEDSPKMDTDTVMKSLYSQQTDESVIKEAKASGRQSKGSDAEEPDWQPVWTEKRGIIVSDCNSNSTSDNNGSDKKSTGRHLQAETGSFPDVSVQDTNGSPRVDYQVMQ
jgi:hypothetical protein